MKARDIVAWNVRERRIGVGQSQEALADAAGINRSFVSDIERGAVSVSVDILDRLAGHFGVEVGEMLRQPPAGSTRLEPLRAGRKPRA